MKKVLLLLPLFFTIQSSAQNNHILGFDGIGPLKTGMTHTEVEKLINKKIDLPNLTDTITGVWHDSAIVVYKQLTAKLFFQRYYTSDKNFEMRVIGIKTSSPLCKTKTGIGIGSMRDAILNTYIDYMVLLSPEFTGEDFSIPSKTRSTISIRDNSSNKVLGFTLHNKKVTAIEISIYFSDDE